MNIYTAEQKPAPREFQRVRRIYQGKYNSVSPEADRMIEKKLNAVTVQIRRNIPGLYSIILIGGYGRGEGAVMLTDEGPQMVNDFDLYVITQKQIADENLEDIALECSRRIGAGGIAHPEEFEGLYTFEKYFHVDIRCLVRKRLHQLPPTIRYFEMKRTASVLWGENSLEFFPYLQPTEIPKPEALRIIMNRMMLLLMAFHPKFVKAPKTVTKDEDAVLKYYIAKSYLTMAESLLLYAGEYQPSYIGRAERLNQIYKEKFPELHQEMPELASDILFFTEYKLNPRPSEIFGVTEWDKCRQRLGRLFRWCLQHFLQTEIPDSWIDVAELLKKKLAKPYFDEYVSAMLSRYHLDNPVLRRLGNHAGQFYLRYRYLQALKRDLGVNYLPAWRLNDPGLPILYTCPLILYSIDTEAGESEEMIRYVIEELDSVYPATIRDYSWTHGKSVWMKAYRLYYLQRFV